MVPARLYTTQTLESWIQYFLSRSDIEDALHATFHRPAVPPGAEMRDVQDSPAWRDLYPFWSRSPYHLVFSIYLDWFNPLTNKIAGM